MQPQNKSFNNDNAPQEASYPTAGAVGGGWPKRRRVTWGAMCHLRPLKCVLPVSLVSLLYTPQWERHRNSKCGLISVVFLGSQTIHTAGHLSGGPHLQQHIWLGRNNSNFQRKWKALVSLPVIQSLVLLSILVPNCLTWGKEISGVTFNLIC